MGNGKVVFRCTSGHNVSIEPKYGGDQAMFRLSCASIGGLFAKPTHVFHREELESVSKNRPAKYRIKVDDKPISLEIEQYDLFYYPIIILKVEGNEAMMHGLEEHLIPRDCSADVDWDAIGKSDFNWNLGREKFKV